MNKQQNSPPTKQTNVWVKACKNYQEALLGRSKDTYATLRAWHILSGSLFLAQLVLVVVYANDFRQSVDVEYLSLNSVTDQLETATRTVAELPLVWLLVFLLAIGVVVNFALASVWFERYKLTLSLNRNRFRWLSYSLARGTIFVILGLLFGISNIALLFTMFMMAVVLGIFNVLVDSYYGRLNKRSRRLSYVLTWVAILVPWMVLGGYAFTNWLYDSASVSSYVYIVTASALIYFLSYDLSFIKQRIAQGAWADYLYGEKVHIILSFVFHSAIVWQIYIALLN